MSFGLQKRSEKCASLADNSKASTASLVANYDTELHRKCHHASDLVFQAIKGWQEHYRVKAFEDPAQWRYWAPYLVVSDKDGFRPHPVTVPTDLEAIFKSASALQFRIFELQSLMVLYSKQTELIIQNITSRAA